MHWPPARTEATRWHQLAPSNGASGTGTVATSLCMTPLDVGKAHLQAVSLSGQIAEASLQTLEPLLCQIALLSLVHREVPPICSGVLEPLYLYPNGALHATSFQDCACLTGIMDTSVKTVGQKRTLWTGLPATRVSHCHLLHCL